jgi:hypothetical protein
MKFVTMWVMLVKQELVMSLAEMEGTKVMEDGGNSEDPSQFRELGSFRTFWNICLTSISKLYLTEIIHDKYHYYYFHIDPEHLNLV